MSLVTDVKRSLLWGAPSFGLQQSDKGGGEQLWGGDSADADASGSGSFYKRTKDGGGAVHRWRQVRAKVAALIAA